MNRLPITVFLSGTRSDLRPYWAIAPGAIRSVEGFEPSMMEDGTASPIPADRWSRRESTTKDLYVALLGRVYGQIPEGADRSLTEQEYDMAGHARVDRLVFLTDKSDPAVVVAESAAAHEAIERFRAKAAKDVVYEKVASPAEFRDRLVAALRDWESRTLRGATTRVDEFYRPWLEGDPDFGHQADLAGRDAELADLEGFINSQKRLLLLESPWGQGKSRLLLDLGRKLDQRVRFFKEEAEFTREALDISAVDPIILVLEDPQRLSPEVRRRLLAFLHGFGADVKLIVSTRPRLVAPLLEDIRELGYSADEVARLELKPVSDRVHHQVIAKILGGESEEAHIISERTKGNIQAGVLTARLFRRGAVTLGQIEDGPQFRLHVLHAFEAAIREHGTGVDERYRDVVRIVALAGPLRTSDDDAVAAMAEFLNWKPHELRGTLADVEDAGLLIRRGELLRVPVDSVAEEVRRQACVNKQGESLGYGEEALRKLWPSLGANVVRNLAALSWELQPEGIKLDFLKEFWPELEKSYAAAPASGRIRLLEAIEDAAPYAPDRVITFVRQALATGLGPEEEAELLRGQIPMERIHDRLSALLRPLIHLHPDYVAPACDLLWQMAKDDTRDPKHHTDSPERSLQDAGQLGLRKDLEVIRAFLRWVQRGHDSGIPPERIAVYVRPLLARELEHDWSDGHAIHFSPRGINAAAVQDVRQSVLTLLERIAEGTSLRAVSAAIAAIGDTLASQVGAFGRQVSQEELAQWHPEELESLERLVRIRARHNSRVVDLCIASEIRWVARHSEHSVLRERAAGLLESLRESVDGSLELALSQDFLLYEDLQEPRAEQHYQDVARIAENYRQTEPTRLMADLADVVEQMKEAGRNPDPTALLHNIARLNSRSGAAMIAELRQDPGHPLVSSLHGVLGGMVQSDPDGAVAASEGVMSSADPRPVRVLARTYSDPAFVERIGSARAVAHLEQLLTHADPVVRNSALSAVGFRDNLPEQERRRLLLSYEVAPVPETGEEWAQALRAGKLVLGCSHEELESVARQLEYSDTLGYWSCELISFLAEKVPDVLVTALVSRVPRRSGKRYETFFDHSQKDPLGALPEAARERGMIALGPYLSSDEFGVSYSASELFGHLATGDPEALRRVALAWIASGDPKQVRHYVESLKAEESEYLIEEEPLVVALLEAAVQQGHDFLQEVESELHSVALRGIRTGTPGAPMPRDVALRDNAMRIALKHSPESVARHFYVAVATGTQERIDQGLRRDAERP